MISRTALLGLLLATATLSGEDKKQDKLDGAWMQTGYENFGKFNKIPADEQATYSFSKEKLAISIPVPKREKEGTYSVDDAKNPKHIDLTYKIGDKEQTLKCIYDLKGDTLRIVQPYDGPEGARPTAFESNARGIIYVYKRKK